MSRLVERLKELGPERRRYALEASTHHLNGTRQYHRLRIIDMINIYSDKERSYA
jgi:hypothetical protein